MGRLSRKKREDIELKIGLITMEDFLDNLVKITWFINDLEYGYIYENAPADLVVKMMRNPRAMNLTEAKEVMKMVDESLLAMYN